MPRTCTICAHTRRAELDAALVAGEPYRGIAQRFAASSDAVLRHKAHVPQSLAKAHEAAAVSQADDLLGKIQWLEGEAKAILVEARSERGDPDRALRAIDRLAKLIELMARLRGEIQDQTTVNIALVTSPEWITLRGRLLTVLEAHPAARQNILSVLGG